MRKPLKKGRLFSDLCSRDEAVRWPAVTAMGIYVSELARQDLEAGRNMMRRFLWQLNDESGGIGWGIPEAMGEAMARHEDLARDFAPILVSYIRANGNYLEFEPLQRGVIWGIARLAQSRPDIMQALDAARQIAPFLNSPDSTARGLSAWALGFLGKPEFLPDVAKLLEDETGVTIYIDGGLRSCLIKDLAEETIRKIGGVRKA